MSQLKPGDIVGISCEVKKGPFSGEHLISFKTVSGIVSGFVRDNELKQTAEGGFVRAEILAVHKTTVEVKVRGSFFTTNGIASIPREMALAA